MFPMKIAHKSLVDMEKEVNYDKVLAACPNLPDPSFLQNSCTGKENEFNVSKQREKDSRGENVARWW